MGNIHVKTMKFGQVVQEMSFLNMSYLELVRHFFAVEWNHLCNSGRGIYEEQFCEIILKLDQWLRRRCLLKIIYLEGVWGAGGGGIRHLLWYIKQNMPYTQPDHVHSV